MRPFGPDHAFHSYDAIANANANLIGRWGVVCKRSRHEVGQVHLEGTGGGFRGIVGRFDTRKDLGEFKDLSSAIAAIIAHHGEIDH